jgi:excisionase family DNA binding protein
MSTSMLHTVGEVAELLRVSTRTIHNLVSRGDLQSVRIGDRLLFHKDELDRFAKEGVRSLRNVPVDRAELESFISSVDGPLKFVLLALAAKLDGLVGYDEQAALNYAIRLAVPLLHTVDTKIANRQTRTEGERLALRYLGLALARFSEAQIAA